MKQGDGVETTHHATIEEAYKELSQEAFAVWVRLMVANKSQLKAGRKAASKLLEYSEGRFNQILRELHHKGYIAFERGQYVGHPTTIIIARRALIAGRNHFVRLS